MTNKSPKHNFTATSGSPSYTSSSSRAVYSNQIYNQVMHKFRVIGHYTVSITLISGQFSVTNTLFLFIIIMLKVVTKIDIRYHKYLFLTMINFYQVI